jgi:hypothetical protein
MVCNVIEPLIHVMSEDGLIRPKHVAAVSIYYYFNGLVFNIVRFDWFYNILYTKQPRYCGMICEPISCCCNCFSILIF